MLGEPEAAAVAVPEAQQSEPPATEPAPEPPAAKTKPEPEAPALEEPGQQVEPPAAKTEPKPKAPAPTVPEMVQQEESPAAKTEVEADELLSPEVEAEQEELRAAKTEADATAEVEQAQAATAIQSAIRSRVVRKTTGARAAERAERIRAQMDAENRRAAALAEALRLSERQRIAEDKYADADQDGNESVSAEELGTLIGQMLVEQGLAIDQQIVNEFVATQFAAADEDNDGTVSFDEFCVYYNTLLDTLQGKAREELLANLKQKDETLSADKAAALAAKNFENDVRDIQALMRLIGVLSHPSVAPVTGTQLLFERGEESVRPDSPPADVEMRTSQGIVLELGRYAQRLLTPWGAYVISYALTFEGYNDEQPRAAAEEAALSAMNTESFYFVLCRISSPLLRLKKLPERTHFVVTSVGGHALPAGEVIGELDDPDFDKSVGAALRARFQAAHAAAELPDLSFRKDPFLVNALLGRTVLVNQKLLAPLEARLKKSKTKPRPGTLITALEMGGNELEAAWRLRQEHLRSVDKLVSARKGYSTREHCDEVLAFCKWDVDAALFVLANEILKRQGLESALGFPSRDEVRWDVASARNEQATAIRALQRQWHIEVRMMKEIVQSAAVEQLLDDMPKHTRPPRAHVEALLHEHGADLEFVAHLLADTAFILDQASELGNPSRTRVEALVLHFEFDEHKVLCVAFTQTDQRAAP
ncbi:hypothetical protein T492DRAFT_887690 [Pavlovales sp. CCMP2436]|nr:hypothetical protein T492DRAFT_887690 [Pavlovales sp. CCMP2436]